MSRLGVRMLSALASTALSLFVLASGVLLLSVAVLLVIDERRSRREMAAIRLRSMRRWEDR